MITGEESAFARLDTLDRTVAAHGRSRLPTVPTVIPEVIGLALVLLVNRSTSQGWALKRCDWRVDNALCCAAEVFACAADRKGAPRHAWRAGGMAGLRRLLGPALHATAAGPSSTLWVDESPTLAAVADWRSANGDGSFCIEMFDVLVASYRVEMAALALVIPSGERPADTAVLRAALFGQGGGMTPAVDDPLDECQCGDYRRSHHDLGCMVCMHGTPPPDGPDGCRRFRLSFRASERQATKRNLEDSVVSDGRVDPGRPGTRWH